MVFLNIISTQLGSRIFPLNPGLVKNRDPGILVYYITW